MKSDVSRDQLRKRYTKEQIKNADTIKVENVYDFVGNPKFINRNTRSKKFFKPNEVKNICVLVALVHLLGVVVI